MYKNKAILSLIIMLFSQQTYTSLSRLANSEEQRKSIVHMLEKNEAVFPHYPKRGSWWPWINQHKFVTITSNPEFEKHMDSFNPTEYKNVDKLPLPYKFSNLSISIVEHYVTHERRFIDPYGRQSHVIATLEHAPSRDNSNTCKIQFYMIEGKSVIKRQEYCYGNPTPEDIHNRASEIKAKKLFIGLLGVTNIGLWTTVFNLIPQLSFPL